MKLKNYALLLLHTTLIASIPVIVAVCVYAETVDMHKKLDNAISSIEQDTLFVCPIEYEEAQAIITAYSPDSASCYPSNDGLTSTGRNAKLAGIAVDPRRIPYGSIVVVDGKPYLADDTGSKMRQSKHLWLDLRLKTHAEAVEYGVKYKTVKILKKES